MYNKHQRHHVNQPVTVWIVQPTLLKFDIRFVLHAPCKHPLYNLVLWPTAKCELRHTVLCMLNIENELLLHLKQVFSFLNPQINSLRASNNIKSISLLIETINAPEDELSWICPPWRVNPIVTWLWFCQFTCQAPFFLKHASSTVASSPPVQARISTRQLKQIKTQSFCGVRVTSY